MFGEDLLVLCPAGASALAIVVHDPQVHYNCQVM